jgi:Fatty acid desaturase
MRILPEEVTMARAYAETHDFARLTEEQVGAIVARGRQLFHWFKAHPTLHNTINAIVLVFIFAADYFVLLRLPGVFLPRGGDAPVTRILLAAAVSGSLHSYILYSLGTFSLHEGAAHHIVFVGSRRWGRAGRWLGANVCRIAATEPDCYAENHMIHHSKFGTAADAEFLNFVLPRRYFLTFLPYAAFINFSDFIAHRPPTYTKSRIVSAAVSTVYSGAYLYFASRMWGLWFGLIVMFVFMPHVGFFLDRLRQFTEHNLMPLENHNGSRSFGIGFWGMTVGGGPWGSPCHLEHHLVPSIPWYQQLLLHRFVVRQMTPSQRKQFLLTPVVGFPLLWLRIVRDLQTFHPPVRT